MVVNARHLQAAALGAILLAAPFGAASAAEPIGNWLTETGTATVRIARCGDELCGTIVALREPNDPATGRPKTDKNNPDASKRSRPVIGIQIIFAMRASGTDRWSGQVYNAEDGRIYSANMVVQGATTLRLEGCVLGGLICKGQTWTRAG